MRSTLIAALFLAFSPAAMAQRVPSAVHDKVLTIRIAVDGICYFLDTSAPCEKLGAYLLGMHLAQDGHVHIIVNKLSRYEVVAVTLKSLDQAHFKVGFVAADPSQ